MFWVILTLATGSFATGLWTAAVFITFLQDRKVIRFEVFMLVLVLFGTGSAALAVNQILSAEECATCIEQTE